MAALGKRFKPEQMVNLLREVDVMTSNGKSLLEAIGVKTAYIEPGSPWENGYCESFNGMLRDELLNGEIFYGVKEAQVIMNQWIHHYNTSRPHSSLGYRPPAPEVRITQLIDNLHLNNALTYDAKTPSISGTKSNAVHE